MQRIKQQYKKGANGVANVQVDVNKELVRISFIDGDDEGTTFKIDLENAPESIKTGRFFVSLSGKGDSVYSVRPAVGTFIVQFVKWARKENTPPTPKEIIGKFGAYSVMTALLKIVKGDFKNMEIPLSLAYKFCDDGSGNVAIPTSDKSGTAAERLINFLEACGVLDEVLPFTDNVLPMLEKKILKKALPFSVVVKGGFVDYISSLEGVTIEADSEDDPEETIAPDDDNLEEDEHAPDPEPTSKPSGAKAEKKIRPEVDEE